MWQKLQGFGHLPFIILSFPTGHCDVPLQVTGVPDVTRQSQGLLGEAVLAWPEPRLAHPGDAGFSLVVGWLCAWVLVHTGS